MCPKGKCPQGKCLRLCFPGHVSQGQLSQGPVSQEHISTGQVSQIKGLCPKGTYMSPGQMSQSMCFKGMHQKDHRKLGDLHPPKRVSKIDVQFINLKS